MRVHIRFLKKDPDLCKWRHSIGGKMLTFYLNSILSAELQNKIAFIPQTVLLSMDETPCDCSFETSSREIEIFLLSIPKKQRNRTVKEIIRKHLHAQSGFQGKTVNPFAADVQMTPVFEQPAVVKTISVVNAPEPEPEVIVQPAVQKEAAEETQSEETEEEREMRMALIAMAGE